MSVPEAAAWNGLQRVLAALQGAPSDRPPFLLNASLYGARLTGIDLETHYRDPQAYVAGQRAVFEAFHPDGLLSPFAVGPFAEAFGSRLRWHERQAPTIGRPAVGSVQEALVQPLPDAAAPGLGFLLDCVRLLAAQKTGSVLVAPMLSPVDLPVAMMGAEAWMDALLFHPEAARQLLDRLAPWFTDLANAFLQAGATVIGIFANFANRGMVPERLVRSHGRPALEAALARVAGPMLVHHGGLTLEPSWASYAGLPQVVGALMDGRDGPAALRRSVGPDLLLAGGLDGPSLGHLSRFELEAALEALERETAADPKFLLATSGADIPWETEPALLEHLARRWSEVGS